MHRNPLWLVFISIVILAGMGYTAYAVVKVWQYVRLDTKTISQEIQWTIVSLKEDAFIPLAHYFFNVDGKNYKGQTRWQEIYLNEWTAREAVSRLKQSPPPVWFDSSSPEISSLQKIFPIKECIYTALLWMLGSYFFFLGYYVTHLTHRERHLG